MTKKKRKIDFFPVFRVARDKDSLARALHFIGVFAFFVGVIWVAGQLLLADMVNWQISSAWDPAFWNFNHNIIPNLGVLVLVLFSVLTLLTLVRSKALHWVLVFVFGFLFSGLFYVGGGWFIGSIFGISGLVLVAIGPAFKKLGPITLSRGRYRTVVSLAIGLATVFAWMTPNVIFYPYIAPYYFTSDLYTGQGGAPNENNTMYITPIWENWNTYESDVEYFKQQLGPGADYVRIGFSASCWYMAELNNATYNYTFNPHASLYLKLNFSVNNDLPVFFHMNGGNWGMETWKNTALNDPDNTIVTPLWADNDSNVQWDQFNRTVPADIAEDQMPLKPRLFTLALTSPIHVYREQNVKDAASIIAEFANEHPDLFVGVSLDSEIHLETTRIDDFLNESRGKSYFDYNPLVISEFRQWMNGRHVTIEAVNQRFGTSFSSFSTIDPPREFSPGNPWWEEWTAFRTWLVKENVEAQARWIVESGIPPHRVYAHQILSRAGEAAAKYERCDPIETAAIESGSLGVTRYGLISPDVFADIYQRAGFNWGVFEWNIWSTRDNTHENYLMMLKMMYQFGARVLCPYAWYEFTWPILQMRNNTAMKTAIRDFARLAGDLPRGEAFPAFLTNAEYAWLWANHWKDIFSREWWWLFLPLVLQHVATWPLYVLVKRYRPAFLKAIDARKIQDKGVQGKPVDAGGKDPLAN